MGEPLTPHATIARPTDVAAALAELNVSEPRYLPYDTIDGGRHVSTPVNAANYFPPGTLEVVESTETGVVFRYTDPIGTIDPSRWARVGSQVVPLPPVADAATDIDAINAMPLWIVGKVTDNDLKIWEYVGAFSTEERAVSECVSECFFVGQAHLDVPFPDEKIEWPGAYFPLIAGAATSLESEDDAE